MTTAVMRTIPAWQRRLAPFVLALTVVGAISTVSYFPGGARLVGESGSLDAPVTIGEEYHFVVYFAPRGGEVTLVKAEAIGRAGPIPIEPPRLLRTTGPRMGSVRGPLRDGSEELRLPGARLDRPDHRKATAYALDFTFRPATAGAFHVESIEVTYNAGFLRTRTATLGGSMCLRASADWRTDLEDRNRLCARTRP